MNIDKDKKTYILHLRSEEEIRKANLELLEELENKLDIQKQNKIKILEEQQNRSKKELELGEVRTKLKI